MNFDRHLLLRIFSYCDYKDVSLFKRISKFFNNQMLNDNFWQEWFNNRDYKEATISYIVSDNSNEFVIGGNTNDIYQ